MASSCPLLKLPAEIREVILRYAFNDIPVVRVRSPSHRRLRPARIDKNCPQGLLSTCHTLREEAIPIFYSSTTMIFHSSCDAVEYLQDNQIDPFVKSNLTHLAMDDGDCQCFIALPRKQLWLVGNAFELCRALKAIEFRIYSREDNPAVVGAVRNLVADWKALAAQCNFKTGEEKSVNMIERIKREEDETATHAIDRLISHNHNINVTETHATYAGGLTTTSSSPTIILSCCNIVMDRNGSTVRVLGDAKEAVERRKVRIGVANQGCADYTDTRCPDRMEVHYMKDLEESVRSAREAAQRGVGRHTWSTARMADVAPMIGRA